MALDANALLLGEATRRVNAAIANYRRIEQQAEADFQRRGGATAESWLQSWAPRTPGVAGAYTAIARYWGRPLGTAARLVESGRAVMVEQARTLESEARGLTGRLASALSEKTAGLVANELLAASMTDDSAVALLQAHQRSRWGQNDPAETPLILTGLRLPSDGRSWAQGAYSALVGEDYARLHPWQPRPSTSAPSFSLPWWVPVGAGAAVGGWLIFRDLFRGKR